MYYELIFIFVERRNLILFELLATLASTYGFGVVLLILIVGIACLIKIITFCKDLWSKRQKFIETNVNKGKAIEAKHEAEESWQKAKEAEIQALKDNVKLLTTIVAQQKDQMDLLVESDMLATKAWIKQQHDIWVPRQCIDSQILDLLESKHKIYKKENGNSWADKLMEELRALPLITIIPGEKSNTEKKDNH